MQSSQLAKTSQRRALDNLLDKSNQLQKSKLRQSQSLDSELEELDAFMMGRHQSLGLTKVLSYRGSEISRYQTDTVSG